MSATNSNSVDMAKVGYGVFRVILAVICLGVILVAGNAAYALFGPELWPISGAFAGIVILLFWVMFRALDFRKPL